MVVLLIRRLSPADAHEPGDSLPRCEDSLLPEPLVNARRPVRPSAVPVHSLDALARLLICLRRAEGTSLGHWQ